MVVAKLMSHNFHNEEKATTFLGFHFCGEEHPHPAEVA